MWRSLGVWIKSLPGHGGARGAAEAPRRPPCKAEKATRSRFGRTAANQHLVDETSMATAAMPPECLAHLRPRHESHRPAKHTRQFQRTGFMVTVHERSPFSAISLPNLAERLPAESGNMSGTRGGGKARGKRLDSRAGGQKVATAVHT